MKQINLKEFRDRTEAVARARKIFIPHLTKNISIAFELYQEILATQKRKVIISTEEGGKKSRTWLDSYERPKCPSCGESLYLRIIREPKGPKNKKGWRTCWECLGPTCTYESYSKKTIRKQVKRLRRKRDG